ncbi:MAG TPA: ROK family protein, partial [Chloroflexota bacterium]|nr:ROK family protein [Chloroflexota bacterium]
MPYALGIDVGGTKILAGVVDLDNGQVVSTAKKKTRVGSGPDDLVQRIADVGREAITQAHAIRKVPVEAAGIGIAGQVERDRGLLIRGPNLGADVTDLPLARRVGDLLGLKVRVANDVEVATIGEHRFGAGRG